MKRPGKYVTNLTANPMSSTSTKELTAYPSFDGVSKFEVSFEKSMVPSGRQCSRGAAWSKCAHAYAHLPVTARHRSLNGGGATVCASSSSKPSPPYMLLFTAHATRYSGPRAAKHLSGLSVTLFMSQNCIVFQVESRTVGDAVVSSSSAASSVPSTSASRSGAGLAIPSYTEGFSYSLFQEPPIMPAGPALLTSTPDVNT
mmetsp:Transcript_14334/g.40749  ORF Transcript_14334/g.40749 Transcript_14334/m.40749 type:complete len:200 (+) Transcript_14334:2946-3545(+)